MHPSVFIKESWFDGPLYMFLELWKAQTNVKHKSCKTYYRSSMWHSCDTYCTRWGEELGFCFGEKVNWQLNSQVSYFLIVLQRQFETRLDHNFLLANLVPTGNASKHASKHAFQLNYLYRTLTDLVSSVISPVLLFHLKVWTSSTCLWRLTAISETETWVGTVALHFGKKNICEILKISLKTKIWALTGNVSVFGLFRPSNVVKIFF